MKTHLILSSALAAAAVSLAGAPAQAATSIDVSSSGDNTGGASYWTASTTFDLPSTFSGAVLNITGFSADDRGVVELNGVVVDSTGIFGPGDGNFHFTADDANNPYTFINGNGAQNLNVTSGFVAGTNTLTFIINDTFDGIYGDFTNGANGPAGPTDYAFEGTVSYGVAGVPEPATWAMMLLGFGMMGAGLRYRRKSTAVRFA